MSRMMKVKLKVYEYKGMLRRDFASVEEAQETAERMASKYPDMIFKHHLVYDDTRDFEELEAIKTASIDISEAYDFERDGPDPNGLDELNKLDIFKEG
jgi:hypothetical protein